MALTLTLNDTAELLEKLINGTLTFRDENATRFVVNALCDALSGERELYELRGYSMADDVNEWLSELALDQDWFSVLTYDFDDAEITDLVIQSSDLSEHYSKYDVEGFVNEYLSEWSQKARHFILTHAQALSSE
ncbi:hypothetical protein WB896_002705 [Vibrio vulnificus]